MIRLRRVALPWETVTRLGEYTEEIAGQTTEKARRAKAAKLWANRRTVRPALLAVLTKMAPGHERCMYCGDSQGTDIDHFDPKSRTPLRTFDWLNHLLACSYCNSNQKRSLFPTDGEGAPLLVDPTLLDPLDHLRLVLPLGEYRARSPQGQACIDVFGLNSRPVLVKGRVDAYATARHSLELWRIATDKGQRDKAREIVQVSWNRPLADVLVAMFHQSEHTAAEALFAGEDDVLALLRDPELREGFLDRS
ncbi:HNH endonuclease signature motif containing protein [Streptomyces sp. TX20-6-3]|uniref:HNH endonuclease signature motif containing protein n=1 Tax=Streptomyces sp. TX20-6-3 TaxID=3028705 RepID=UPI0029BDD70A|nr:HNH endonuclease signature motif containing protein [Streptomyces sp. TX20-6-3]MDX2558961.1 HNH endonuclease signature motif containing protein [Streptomyces sp. TX20-6-3]